MKVYLVWWDDGIDTLVMHGVFSSKKKAYEKINTLASDWHLDYFEIEEREIDA